MAIKFGFRKCWEFIAEWAKRYALKRNAATPGITVLCLFYVVAERGLIKLCLV
jgi:hypothetical protein